MALDQFVMAPFFISGTVAAVMFLEGKGHDIKSKLSNDLFTIVRSNWLLWVPFQFVNFGFVPAHLQVWFSGFIQLASSWTGRGCSKSLGDALCLGVRTGDFSRDRDDGL